MKRPAIIENRPCVYMIKNTVNGKVYIGSSVNGYRRYNSHISHLRNGVHSSIRLQRSFNKYGAEAFVFIVLKYTDKNQHRKEEARVLKMLDATNPENGYNNSDLTERGVIKHTESSLEKMRIAQKISAKKRCRAVICSNGMRFDSLKDAGKFFGICSSSVLRLARNQRTGKHSKLKGLSFNFAEETENE